MRCLERASAFHRAVDDDVDLVIEGDVFCRLADLARFLMQRGGIPAFPFRQFFFHLIVVEHDEILGVDGAWLARGKETFARSTAPAENIELRFFAFLWRGRRDLFVRQQLGNDFLMYRCTLRRPFAVG